MAAVTLGVALRPRPFIDREGFSPGGDRQRTLCWLLSDTSTDARYKTRDLWLWWNDPEWISAHPEHPLSILRTFSDSLAAAEEREPDYAQLVFRKGHRTLCVPRSWPRERILESLKKLESNS